MTNNLQYLDPAITRASHQAQLLHHQATQDPNAALHAFPLHQVGIKESQHTLTDITEGSETVRVLAVSLFVPCAPTYEVNVPSQFIRVSKEQPV